MRFKTLAQKTQAPSWKWAFEGVAGPRYYAAIANKADGYFIDHEWISPTTYESIGEALVAAEIEIARRKGET